MLAYWLSSTDHKIIGYLYLITSFGFFLFAGILAMIMRAQLIGPNNSIVSDQQYNELFTMHGTIMLLLFATPLFGERVTVDDPWGFGNSLEWATSCPRRGTTFTRIPRIRSERPAFDLHYPHIKQGRDSLGVRQSLSGPWS